MTRPVLSMPLRVAEVGNWQRFLNLAVVRSDLDPLKEDEDFGPKTANATRLYQLDRGLSPSSVVDELTRKRAIADGFIPFVQAKNAGVLFPQKQAPRLIVIHTMENAEKPYSAENVAAWFAGETWDKPPMASAHYCIDEDSVVQCVRDTDQAWHAGPVNGFSLGLEHAGYAKQTNVDWFDRPSQAILWRSAQLASTLCKRYGIPVQMATEASIADKTAKGFCGHVDVTKAFKHKAGHWDPGPNFPWAHYLELVRSAIS